MIDRRSFLKGASAAVIASMLSGRLFTLSYAQSQNLADQINSTLNSVQNWNVGMYGSLANIGVIMSRSTGDDYDSWITANAKNNNWLGVFQVKSIAQHSGYDSSTIEGALKLALENMPMLEHYLPATTIDSDGTKWFYPFYRYSLYGYQFSSDMNIGTDRWNSVGAFQYLAKVYDTFGRSFYGLNDNLDNGSTYAVSEPYGTRWLDVGKLMGSFLTFYDLGVSEALPYALDCWNELNTNFWHTDHYTYSTGVSGYEFSAMDVIPNALRLKKLVPNLPDAERITTDLISRYLAGWGSGQWSGSTVNRTVTEHLTGDSGTGPGNPELRLDGTLNAWILLHQAYSVLDDNSRSMIRSMLEGIGMEQASLSLLGSDLRQSNGQFLLRQNVVNTTNIGDGTARASLCLVLNGISVSSGSGLAIPLLSEFENDISAVNSYHFGFNYAEQQVKVPVWGGTTLKFLFGATPVSHAFVNSGVYVVNFAEDWESILSTVWSPLNFNETYLQSLESISVSVDPTDQDITVTVAPSNWVGYVDAFVNGKFAFVLPIQQSPETFNLTQPLVSGNLYLQERPTGVTSNTVSLGAI